MPRKGRVWHKTGLRAQAQAIAGKPEKMHFDARTAAFSLRFEPTLNATTEVYLNEELHYPTGCARKLFAPYACQLLQLSRLGTVAWVRWNRESFCPRCSGTTCLSSRRSASA